MRSIKRKRIIAEYAVLFAHTWDLCLKLLTEIENATADDWATVCPTAIVDLTYTISFNSDNHKKGKMISET